MNILSKSALPLILFLSLSVICCNPKKQVEEEAAATPNVVIILTDDMGYADISSYGAKGYSTPNIDQLAEEGIRFTNFYVPEPVCSASRAGLLTGCYPTRLGIHYAYSPGSKKGLNPNEITIAEMLKQKDYATAIFGKWHLGDAPEFMPLKQGFDEYFGIPYSNDMWPNHPWQGTVFDFPPLPLYENDQVIDTLKDQSLLTRRLTEKGLDFISRNKDKPFFLYLAHPQPHVPLYVSDKFADTTSRGLYGDVITELDWSVGEIMQSLDENGLTENTIVVFTSDNGPWLQYGDHAGSADPFREGKATTWEGGVRVPGIIRFPALVEAQQVSDEPVMTIDLLPTIAELTGAPLPPKEIDGKSLVDLLSGQTTKGPQEAYYFYFEEGELQAVRSQDWKLVFPHQYRSLNGKPGGKNGLPVQAEVLELQKAALYNMSTDSTEVIDVATENQQIVSRLERLAQEKREEIGDGLTGTKGKENRPVGLIQKQ